MKVILVRHGVSMHNSGGRISGGESDPPLSPEGIAEAQKISSSFDQAKIDSVYASPLKRAYKTAQILTDGQKKIQVDHRLVEMKFGSWEGKEDLPLRKEYPDAFMSSGVFSPNYIKYAKKAESYPDLIRRCRHFMSTLKQKEAGHTVMVVCHGFTIRGLLAAIFHMNIEDIYRPQNVSFTEISFDEQDDWRPELLSYNCRTPRYLAVKKKG